MSEDYMELYNKLDEIHEMVYKNFTYKTDKRQYGLEEHWVMPEDSYDGTQPFTGDCEDFALACRKLVRDAGIDNSRLVYCKDETGEGHGVLEVEGWILDNRQRSVVSNDRLTNKGYEFIAVSGYNSGEPWRMIKKG